MIVPVIARLALLLAIAVACGGCLYSVNSFFPDDACIFDPQLVGVWQNDDDATIVVQPMTDDSLAYDIFLLSKDSSDASHLHARMARIEGRTFVDIAAPDRPSVGFGTMHEACRLELSGNDLRIKIANADEMNRLIEASRADTTVDFRGVLNHVDSKSGLSELMMVSPTSSMRQFLEKCANQESFWLEETLQYRRLQLSEPWRRAGSGEDSSYTGGSR